MSDIREDLNRKMRNRLSAEITAYHGAAKVRESIDRHISSLQQRIDDAFAEKKRLDEKVEWEIIDGNTPNAEIQKAAAQQATIEALRKQLDKAQQEIPEADDKVEKARNGLEGALKRAIITERDLLEERLQADLDRVMVSIGSWKQAVPGVYADLGLRHDGQKDKRLTLLAGLSYDALMTERENCLSDGFFHQAKKPLRDSRRRALAGK